MKYNFNVQTQLKKIMFYPCNGILNNLLKVTFPNNSDTELCEC